MAVPSNAQYRNGVTPVTGDQFNTFIQGVSTVAVLRTFVGVSNMEVSLLGLTAAGDGGAGIFWWNPSSTAADDGINVIVPPAAASGAWNRLPTTAIFASGDFSGPPILPGYPIGQAGNLAYSLVEITTTTVQPVIPEFGLSVNMTSETGASGSVATSSNKVGIYSAVEAKVGSGNVWAFNPLVLVDSGACLIGGVQIIEADFANNSGQDFGVGIASAGLTGSDFIGMQITGIGTNANSAALAILGSSTSLVGAWNAGIVFANSSVNEVSILDENSPTYSYRILGAPTFGFDTSAGNPGTAIRLGSQHKFSFRNAANSADIIAIQSTGTDQILIGPSSAPVILGTTLLGFYSTVPISKPAASGSRGGNAALASLLTALANLGLLTDSTTA